ncbi:MAG: glycosyltransferase [Planctomycetota bacterium]|nr:glycosyltransferase [Planctomycetota bacterium]
MHLLIISDSPRTKLLSNALNTFQIKTSFLSSQSLLKQSENLPPAKSKREVFSLFLNEVLLSLRPDVALLDAQIPFSADKIRPPSATQLILFNFEEPFYRQNFSPFASICTSFFSSSLIACKTAKQDGFPSSVALYPPSLEEAFTVETPHTFSPQLFLIGNYSFQREKYLNELRKRRIECALAGGGWHKATSLSPFLRRKLKKELTKEPLSLLKSSGVALYVPNSQGGLTGEVFDSAAAGIPIVTLPSADTESQFDEGSVLIVNNEKEASGKIESLLAFDLGRAELSNWLRKTARDRFCAEARAKQLIEALENL